ncbi:hypothetical protein evm_010396 [Chilo suppressalis]|nr:hypothetical protein evm_010396 [Chilo suppressalis]
MMRQVCCSSHHHLADLNPIPYPRSPRTLLTSENTTPPKNPGSSLRSLTDRPEIRQLWKIVVASNHLVKGVGCIDSRS